jgi:RNA polymerase sigma factor (sigma-70 family)
MPKAPFSDFLHYLRALYPEEAAAGSSDGELLDRFVCQREEEAFTVLVRRHGPMVLSVCQRLLGDRHLAEDCFQATFIVLARQAGKIRSRNSLGTWLYAVGQRVARKARAKLTARRNRERQLTTMARAARLDESTWQELRSIIDQEIGRLPEKYQAPVVLCHLEGKTHQEAARELGWPKSSLERRLARGRELLRHQLIRRGVTLSAAAVTTALCQKVTGAPVRAFLAMNTVKAATSVAAGKMLPGGCVTARALSLAEEALGGLASMKAKLIAIVLALGVAVGSAGWASHGRLGEPSLRAASELKQPRAATNQLTPTKTQAATDQYGDPLPEGAIARLGPRRFRHDGFGTALAFSPDGKTLVGSSVSGVMVWDAATGQVKHQLGAGQMPFQVAVSPDSKVLATSDFETPSAKEATIKLWDLASGKLMRALSGPKGEGQDAMLVQLSFTPDGKSLACLNRGGKAVFVDLESGAIRQALKGQDATQISKLAISSDGKLLATADSVEGIEIWDARAGTLIRKFKDASKGRVTAMTFAPDGKELACGLENHAYVLDAVTGMELARSEAAIGDSIGLDFNPDRRTLVWGGNRGKIVVWDWSNDKMLHHLDGHATVGYSVVLSPDGKTAALGTTWQTVQLWDVEGGKKRLSELAGHSSAVENLAFAPDGTTLVSAAEFGSSIVWDTGLWRPRAILPGGMRSVSFSSDGKQLATIEADEEDHAAGIPAKKVQLWDSTAAAKTRAISVPDVETQIYSVMLTGGGRKLFTLDWHPKLSNQATVRRWDVATARQERAWTITGTTGNTELLAPDGRLLVDRQVNGDIGIYDLESGRKRVFHGEATWAGFKISNDGRVLASGTSGPTIRLWETLSGKEICVFEDHHNSVRAIAFSPDGRLLASGEGRAHLRDSSGNQDIRLWDMANGKEVARFSGFKSNVSALAFSPDGNHLVAGLRDSTILVWDAGKVRGTLTRDAKVSMDELESCWNDLVGGDVARAHRAIWMMIEAPQDSLPFLSRRLKPAAAVDPGRMEQWIAALSSDKFAVRQAAGKDLEKIGAQVEPLIEKALKGNISLEARRRLDQILNGLYDVPGPDTVRALRAIMVLERIGSSEAQRLLQVLVEGPAGARETEEAKASLQRLRSKEN